MKKLKDYAADALEGERETITATDFRQFTGEVLDQASLGKVFTVTKNGHPVVMVVQYMEGSQCDLRSP